eukprot:scaffold120463_cov16-Tisochrysis_lutea.AAC.2
MPTETFFLDGCRECSNAFPVLLFLSFFFSRDPSQPHGAEHMSSQASDAADQRSGSSNSSSRSSNTPSSSSRPSSSGYSSSGEEREGLERQDGRDKGNGALGMDGEEEQEGEEGGLEQRRKSSVLRDEGRESTRLGKEGRRSRKRRTVAMGGLKEVRAACMCVYV